MALTVSVALCTRNGAPYLAAQVRSVCTQLPAPLQIVLSDDDSGDDSVAVVRQTLAECDPGAAIELVVLENRPALGVTRNFEQAVRACRGDLVALCDQDDVWHPDRLARMAAAFDEQPELLLLHSDAWLVDAELKPLGHSLFHALEVQPAELAAIGGGRAFDVLLRRNLVTGATTVFRRNLLEAALPFPEHWLHDEWLGAIAAATGRMDVLNELWIDYRQHASNQIGARRPTLGDKLRKALVVRGDKHRDRLMRAQQLCERLSALAPGQVSKAVQQAQRDKVAHQRFRAELPNNRLARVLPVLREAASGRYDRYGRGWHAIAQDLLEAGG